jgi:hypothetical protein
MYNYVVGFSTIENWQISHFFTKWRLMVLLRIWDFNHQMAAVVNRELSVSLRIKYNRLSGILIIKWRLWLMGI